MFSEWAAQGEAVTFRDLAGVSNDRLELRALGVGEETGGETTVPSGFYSGLVAGMDSTNAIRREATVIQTDGGERLKVPVFDDLEVEAVIVPESAQAAGADVAVDDLTLGAFTVHSKLVRVSTELLVDAGTEFQFHLGGLLGKRLGRLTNRLFINGDGDGEPSGILATATAVQAAAPTALTYNELVGLRYGINSAYQVGGKWLMSPATLAAVRKIVDDASRPVFGDDLLLGRPVVLTEAMPSIEPEAKPIAFGDLSAYLIREVNDVSVKRYVETYAQLHQVGLAAILRTDGALSDSHAVHCLQMAEA